MNRERGRENRGRKREKNKIQLDKQIDGWAEREREKEQRKKERNKYQRGLVPTL